MLFKAFVVIEGEEFEIVSKDFKPLFLSENEAKEQCENLVTSTEISYMSTNKGYLGFKKTEVKSFHVICKLV